jgi:hypothetical protein
MELTDDGKTVFEKSNSSRKTSSPFLYNTLRSKWVLKLTQSIKDIMGLSTLGFGRPDRPMTMDIHNFLAIEFSQEIALIEEILEKNLSYWK